MKSDERTTLRIRQLRAQVSDLYQIVAQLQQQLDVLLHPERVGEDQDRQQVVAQREYK